MSKFASKTVVPVARSRQHIEELLTKYGADQFLYGWKEDSAVIGFRCKNRQIKFTLAITKEESAQSQRSKWRVLLLVIKAKLEAVESRVTTFDEEFLAHIVLPDGRTFGQFATPQIAAAYDQGNMPALLPGATS